jgi:hypothetical protein
MVHQGLVPIVNSVTSRQYLPAGSSAMSRLWKLQKIDLLKIRASYGITGNNSFGNFTAIPTLAKYNYIFNGALVQGQTIGALGNPELAWERNKQFDIGLELAMFNNRVSVNYDYYHKMSDGLIMARPVPRASGFTLVYSTILVSLSFGATKLP